MGRTGVKYSCKTYVPLQGDNKSCAVVLHVAINEKSLQHKLKESLRLAEVKTCSHEHGKREQSKRSTGQIRPIYKSYSCIQKLEFYVVNGGNI